MSATEPATEGDDREGDVPTADLPDNVLFDWYRDRVGEPEGKTDVYAGFGLFFGGIVLALGGLVIFLYAIATTQPDTGPYFGLVEPAFVFGMLAIPASISGVVVLLPIDRRAVYATAAGDAVTALSVLLFVTAYPANWSAFGPTTTAVVLGLYALGLTLVVGSTGAALVAEQIERARTPHPSEIEPMEEESDDEEYSEGEIQQDIEDAMKDVELSWGGVRKHEGQELTVDVGEDIETASLDDVEATTTRSSGVDEQVAGLKGLKGGENNTATSNSTVDEQTAALNELKRQKREDEGEAGEAADDGSPFERLVRTVRNLLG